jgi:hypothetical protein
MREENLSSISFIFYCGIRSYHCITWSFLMKCPSSSAIDEPFKIISWTSVLLGIITDREVKILERHIIFLFIMALDLTYMVLFVECYCYYRQLCDAWRVLYSSLSCYEALQEHVDMSSHTDSLKLFEYI